MTYIVSVTSQGQITIPKEVREALAISTPAKIFMSVQDKQATIKPVPDFFSLYQSIKSKKRPVDWDEVEKAAGDAFAKSGLKGFL